MKLAALVLKFIVSLVATIFWFFSVRDRVTFSSYFSNTPHGNMKLIIEEVRSRGFNVVENFNKFNNTFFGRLRYFLHMAKELYLFNTSRLIVLDGNSFILSNIAKKREVKSIQIWHATGAFKKFGNDTERLYPIKNLDYAITSSTSLKNIYAHAFNVDINNVLPLGIPRMDSLFFPDKVESYRKEILARHKGLAGKKVILFAPTFRGKGAFDIQVSPVDLNNISRSISDDYVIAIRMHPLMVGYSDYSKFINLSDEDLIKTLCATDLLITDYSSIIFEFAALRKPMLFFVPDLNEYLDDRGFYEDYETFVPGKVCKTEGELIASIVKADFQQEKVERFSAKYLDFMDGSSTKRIADLIERLMPKSPK